MAKKVRTIVLRSERSKAFRIFEKVVGVAAFCVLYLTLVSALPFHAAYYAALPFGMITSVVMLLFFENKYVRYGTMGVVALYAVLSVAAGYSVFRTGTLTILNGAIQKLNAARHYGLSSYAVQSSFGAVFLVSSSLSALLGIVMAFSVKQPHAFICVFISALLVLLFAGLYPQPYTAVLTVLIIVCMVGIANGLDVKSAGSFLLIAVIAVGVMGSGLAFSGSSVIDKLYDRTAAAFGNAVYGNSLPSGRLDKASGMRSSDKERLRVSVSPLTPTLYLRGFTGSDLSGSRWNPTDKNSYVENGYQGLMQYLSAGSLPTLQFSEYSELCGQINTYGLTVENVSADRRYLYAPYTLSGYSSDVRAYYDMGLQGGVFSPKEYTFSVFAADASSERVTQAEWVTSAYNRTVPMDEYMELEGQYRAFVYDHYTAVDTDAVSHIIGDFSTQSINTATQFIRSYFLDAFTYSDVCDGITDDFATDFFGGKIQNANAAYFASAATCMFRALGFAARYVEGYTVNADASNMSVQTVSVTGSDTHAWTEVYFDGIGFLPIEVTPTFFSERNPDVIIAPEESDNLGSESNSPEGQPETPDSEIDPSPPPNHSSNSEETVDPADVKLLGALKVLVPVFAVVLFVLAVVLFFVLRRHIVCLKQRKKLEGGGEEYGRAAYGMMENACKHYGGFSEDAMREAGIEQNATARFMRIVERCVYADYLPNDAERKFVLWYITYVQSTLLDKCGFIERIYRKYLAGRLI